MPDYDGALKALDKAYIECETAEEYSREIMRIWAEQGLVDGEWSCKLEDTA
jgi:hypothetical protein